MDKIEFIDKVLGARWVNRASSFTECDCWGLVLLYYKHVLGIELPEVDGYNEKINIADCWKNETSTGRWVECDKPQMDGLVFTCYRGEQPSHVGVTIGGGKVLHTTGGLKSDGSVQVNTIRAVERMYGKMTYHKFTG